MCTFNLTFNDVVVKQARQSFPTQTAITTWMQQQMERMLRQVAIEDAVESKEFHKINVSERIKALSNVPPSSSHADYKEEIADIMKEKY